MVDLEVLPEHLVARQKDIRYWEGRVKYWEGQMSENPDVALSCQKRAAEAQEVLDLVRRDAQQINRRIQAWVSE